MPSFGFDLPNRQKRIEIVNLYPKKLRCVGPALHSLSLVNIDEFVRKYKKQALIQCKTITPPSFDAPKKIPLDKIYVPPKLQHMSKLASPADSAEKVIDLDNFLQIANRAVVVGMPGGGKSTLTLKISNLLITKPNALAFGRVGLVPISIALRKYAADKKQNGMSITDHMERHCNTELQFKPPPGSIELLLRSGRALAIFDGLDELIDTSDRRDVSGDVESFCNLFPGVPVLVTSREVGYDQAPLSDTLFQLYRLAPFGQKEIHNYVENWFGIAESKLDIASDKSSIFLSESRSVQDLCENPLMLALMCSIFRGERYLPKNRPELYAKCAEMLFERWDKDRGIKYVLPFESLIRPAMNYLAYWIYCSPTLASGGVAESELVNKAAEFLYSRRFEDLAEAEYAARRFIEFCAGRAWVFTDTGTTAAGEKLYQFTHRTFLEYFAAAFIARSRVTATDLLADLTPHIAAGEWDMVAQLSIQIHHMTRDDGDQLLVGLLNSASIEVNQLFCSNLIDFSLRCLVFLAPTPSVTRKILDAWLRNHAAREKALRANAVPTVSRFRPISGVFSIALENRACATDQLCRTIDDLSKLNRPDASSAVNIILSFSSEVAHKDGSAGYWADFSKEYAIQNKSFIRELAQSDFTLCRTVFFHGLVTMIDVCDWFGIAGLFDETRSTIVSWVPIAPWLLLTANNAATDNIATDYLQTCFRDFGSIAFKLLQADRPWSNYRWPNDYLGRVDSIRRRLPMFSGDAWFVLFAIGASMLEFRQGAISIDDIKGKIPFREFRNIYLTRIESMDPPSPACNAELTELRFTDEQKAFAMDWARGVITLMERSKDSKNGDSASP